MPHPFSGSFVALPTPFRDGELDLEALETLIDEHVERDTDGLVISGTTGEAPTLTEGERRTLLQAAVRHAGGRLPVVAGVGSNATHSTVELAKFAASAGADGLLVVTPYYNRPSRMGLLRHFGAVADAVDLPIMLYNVPGRTGLDMQPSVVRDLARHCANVVAIKEVTSDRARIQELVAIDDIAVLCGEDSALAAFAQEGAHGAVSVVGNILPDTVAALLVTARPGGNEVRAAGLVEELAPLVHDLYLETNPVPVKTALAWLGWCTADVRGPLAPLEDANRLRLEETLAATPRAIRKQAALSG